eukprot:CAMPEP_0174926150 /NCGR_PEP_ID=MMETSP1355-20121228/9999_1 /TAXON_ID=464990 /ORGANISM="Hemiselmis tepida, Strain CCMP443" /LENGTH=224 /DNA_ID=CAMNT_0016172167 /DNA_START=23 /DNA_END=697 /DNA_ORIENTATION=+
MLSKVLFVSSLGAAAAFAPGAMLPATARRTPATSTKMQLWDDGKSQGKGVTAIPFAGRPDTPAFDGTWVGDTGFDPLCISGNLDMKFLREAELKHCRVAMLATAGAIAQDLFSFPGAKDVLGDAKMTALHDVAVSKGAMGQLLLWIGFFELFSTAAVIQMCTDDTITRKPGDFGFDPLSLGKGDKLARMELAEIKNGRLAMIAIGGIVHHYLITGKGPMELITG